MFNTMKIGRQQFHRKAQFQVLALGIAKLTTLYDVI